MLLASAHSSFKVGKGVRCCWLQRTVVSKWARGVGCGWLQRTVVSKWARGLPTLKLLCAEANHSRPPCPLWLQRTVVSKWARGLASAHSSFKVLQVRCKSAHRVNTGRQVVHWVASFLHSSHLLWSISSWEIVCCISTLLWHAYYYGMLKVFVACLLNFHFHVKVSFGDDKAVR